MTEANPIARVLRTVLANQISRTEAVLEDLDEDTFARESGADCNSIRDIGCHLIKLRRFQLHILESPQVAEIDVPDALASVAALREQLDAAAAMVDDAIAQHDVDDWYAAPSTPREGPWGDEPTIDRFVRPLNDFTNHLGSMRALRRLAGAPADRTQ
jgi:hypothetical protein